MTKHKRILAAVALLAIAAGSMLWIAIHRSHRISEANCQRIHEGMSRTEVERLLGKPGNYSTRFIVYHDGGYRSLELEYLYPQESWIGDEASIVVTFDRQGHVSEASSWPVTVLHVGFFESLQWRIRRLWELWTA
jgi:hypothetical protein